MSEATIDRPSKTVEVVRGQYHKFMLIPLLEADTRWFDAGPFAIGVESRALGTCREDMVRGPSIHVMDAAREQEFVRFDLFGKVPHYHYILNGPQHNVVWGYDPMANGPMLDWVIDTLERRLPAMLRRAEAGELAARIEAEGWDRSVLPQIRAEAEAALAERPDDVERARAGIAWMRRWKELHPQFNTVDY